MDGKNHIELLHEKLTNLSTFWQKRVIPYIEDVVCDSMVKEFQIDPPTMDDVETLVGQIVTLNSLNTELVLSLEKIGTDFENFVEKLKTKEEPVPHLQFLPLPHFAIRKDDSFVALPDLIPEVLQVMSTREEDSRDIKHILGRYALFFATFSKSLREIAKENIVASQN